MESDHSMQGVMNNKLKSKGRDRGMGKNQENSNSKDNLVVSDSTDTAQRQKERSRRTKAGYEIYQVKKKLPVSQYNSNKFTSNSSNKSTSNYKSDKKRYDNKTNYRQTSKKSSRRTDIQNNLNKRQQHKFNERRISDTTLSNSLSSKEDWETELNDNNLSYESTDSFNKLSENSDISSTNSPIPVVGSKETSDRAIVNSSETQNVVGESNKQNVFDNAKEVVTDNPDVENERTGGSIENKELVVNEQQNKIKKRPLTEQEKIMKIKGQLLLECPCKYMPEEVDHSCLMCDEETSQNDENIPQNKKDNNENSRESIPTTNNTTQNIEVDGSLTSDEQKSDVKESERKEVTNVEHIDGAKTTTFQTSNNSDNCVSEVKREENLDYKGDSQLKCDNKEDTQLKCDNKENDHSVDVECVKMQNEKPLDQDHAVNKDHIAKTFEDNNFKDRDNANVDSENYQSIEIPEELSHGSKDRLDKNEIDEINALFVKKDVNKSSEDIKTSNENPSNIGEDSAGDNCSKSSITVECLEDSPNTDRSNVTDHKSRRRSSESKRNPEQLQRSRQRNFMSSIVSILNENKHYDETHKVPTTQDDLPRKYPGERSSKSRKDTRSEKKRSDRRKKESKKKQTSPMKQSNTTIQSTDTEEYWVSDDSLSKSPKAGLIYLPESDLEKTPDPTKNEKKIDDVTKKHVHFDNHIGEIIEESPNKPKQMLSDGLSIIEEHQKKLAKLLKKGFSNISNVKQVVDLSEMIQGKYSELILQYAYDAMKNDFEGSLWKTAFHNVILHFRKYLDENSENASMQEIGGIYWQFLQNGIQFLDELMLQIQEKHDMLLDDYISDPATISTCPKKVRLSLRSCHLLLIYSGDLERYICQLRQDDSYKNAQECYKKAQILAPKNGKSYNQLAVVAVYIKHKLDAVYYYARSLQASNPILTAKERLTSIFYEIKRKAEVYHQKQNAILNTVEQQVANISTMYPPHDQYNRQTDHLRDEIWTFYRQGKMFKVMLTNQNEIIHLTPVNNKPIIESSLENKVDSREERKITLKKINRGFILNFLYIHCKLYTNVGLESFTAVHQETLSDLAMLLKYPKTSSMREENLVKYMAINIFTIHILLEKQGNEEIIQNSALDFAITFGMDMFSVFCKHCLDVPDLSTCRQYMGAMRVWLTWMANHTHLVVKSSASEMFDIWTTICDYINKISKFPVDVDIVLNKDESKNEYLSEDLLLSGFKPLPTTLRYIRPNPSHLEEAFMRRRIDDMLNLIKQMDENGSLPFAYDEKDRDYKPIQPSRLNVSPQKSLKNIDFDDIDESDASTEVTLGDDEEDEIDDVSHIAELKLQKAALEKQLEENERKRQAALSVIESHKSLGRHISENSPTYLVADTNCYIDHIDFIKAIVESKDFTLIVPLIVINELDGLKVGKYYDTTKHNNEHQRFVQEKAKLAIDYLEYRFSNHDSNIRAITSSGSEMDTIVFRAEEFSPDRGTNDDVILSCCLKYCSEHILTGESSVVHRNVVLLTHDRNLRLKAHTRYVPTIDLLTFMRMARFL